MEKKREKKSRKLEKMQREQKRESMAEKGGREVAGEPKAPKEDEEKRNADRTSASRCVSRPGSRAELIDKIAVNN